MKYEVISTAAFVPQGVSLRLTPDQARRRAHLLDDAGRGFYRTKDKVFFKSGEIIETDKAGASKLSRAGYREIAKDEKPVAAQGHFA